MSTTTLSSHGDEIPIELLVALFKALRLPGVARELPEILAEAATDSWGQMQLLHEIFRREEVRKNQRRFERNLKASSLSDFHGLEHFDFEVAEKRGVKSSIVRDLAQCEFLRARRNVILAGMVGTGKTYLARTLGVEALKRGFKVLFFNTAALVDRLYAKRNSFQFGKIYGRIREVDLLILDDLAYLPYSPEKVEFLFSLIVERHELKSGGIIMTSNTDVQEWWQFFPSKSMGMAFSDRLLEGAQGIRYTGPSIRGEMPPRREPPAVTPPSPTPPQQGTAPAP